MKALFIGLTTIDIQYTVTEHPKPNSKVKTEAPTLLVGGPAANAAITFAHLGGEANFLTLMGDNPFCPFFHKDMAEHKVQAWDLASGTKKEAVLATVLTNSENGDRTIVTNNPTDDHPKDYLLDQALQNIEYDIVLWDGFYPSIAEYVFNHKSSENIPVVFDGGSWKPWVEKLLPSIDVAICSEVFLPPHCMTHEDVFDFLDKKGVKEKMITRGERSVLLHTQTTSSNEIEVEKVRKVIDTLGAGDIFHGAFCFYFAQNNGLINSIQKASIVAAKSIQYQGTRSWMKE